MPKQTERDKAKNTSLSSADYRRIVVKFGTSLLTGGSDRLDQTFMAELVSQTAHLHRQGKEIIIVSSGAIAAGRHKLGLSRKIKDIPFKQVLASVGQGRLMNIYDQIFAEHHITVAQALLTRVDLSHRSGYLNARNTLLALLDLGVICIVNENDVVAVEEIEGSRFGDNDNLSAMVANLIDADLLVILTDIAGLYTADPHCDPSAELIPEVARIDKAIESLVTGTCDSLGTGGMITKIQAARLATGSGIHVIIADGREKDVISRLAAGEAIGTHFPPSSRRLDSRRRWMLSGLCTRGRIFIDNGAATALIKQNRSLLATGIRQSEGKFDRGDIVAICDIEGNQLGYGITNYNSHDVGIIKGVQSSRITALLGVDYGPEVVHRNNLTLMRREEPIGNRQTIQLQR